MGGWKQAAHWVEVGRGPCSEFVQQVDERRVVGAYRMVGRVSVKAVRVAIGRGR